MTGWDLLSLIDSYCFGAFKKVKLEGRGRGKVEVGYEEYKIL